MLEVSRVTDSLDATFALACGLASLLRAGDTVLLQGELGAGKTTFTRGVMSYFNPTSPNVSSPTFVMVNQYPVSQNVNRIQSVTHVDAYRLGSTADLDALGWDQLFSEQGAAAPGTVALIEWPERITEALPRHGAIVVELFHAGQASREFKFSFPVEIGERPETRLFLEREPAICPTTKAWVSPTNQAYPFANDRARMADLGKWMSGANTISRPATEDDAPPGK